MNSTAQQPKAAPSGINEAQAARKANLDEIARVNAGAEPIGKARAACHEDARAAADLQRIEDELRAARGKLVAAQYTGKGDDAALKENTKQLDAVMSARAKADAKAANAKLALPELERQYAEATAPLQRLTVETPRLKAELLASVAEVMLSEYGEQGCKLYDSFLELVCLAQLINTNGRPAGLAPVMPEVPVQFDLPGITVGQWKLHNAMNANAEQLNQARQRLAAKLRDLNVEV